MSSNDVESQYHALYTLWEAYLHMRAWGRPDYDGLDPEARAEFARLVDARLLFEYVEDCKLDLIASGATVTNAWRGRGYERRPRPPFTERPRRFPASAQEQRRICLRSVKVRRAVTRSRLRQSASKPMDRCSDPIWSVRRVMARMNSDSTPRREESLSMSRSHCLAAVRSDSIALEQLLLNDDVPRRLALLLDHAFLDEPLQPCLRLRLRDPKCFSNLRILHGQTQ